MRILIHTMHMSKSIGASLQSCALAKKLEKMGHDPHLLYYILPFYTDVTRPPKSNKSIKSFLSSCVNGRVQEADRKCFMQFKKEHHPPITRLYTNPQELMEDPPMFDAYICGSDQIWNPNITHFDNSYFFPFVKTGAPKISYAASIGCDQITPAIDDYLKTGLLNMDAIGVREDTAVDLVKHYLPESKITQNIDPTFLLEYDEWSLMESIPKTSLPDHYCLYYPMGNADVGISILKKLKEKYSMPCVSFNGSVKKEAEVDFNLHGIGPGEFLYLCHHADMILTNSFHGFSLAVNYRKPVICFTKPGQNSRMESLARLLNLNKLMVSNAEEIKATDWDTIWMSCYDGLGEIIDRQKQYAEHFLEEALKL